MRLRCICWAGCFAAAAFVASPAALGVNFFVDADAGPNGDGSSWETPFNRLEVALAAAIVNQSMEPDTIRDNSAQPAGGGVMLLVRRLNHQPGTVALIHCALRNNQAAAIGGCGGGGVTVNDVLNLTGCDECETTGTIENSILWGNTVDDGTARQIVLRFGDLVVNKSDVECGPVRPALLAVTGRGSSPIRWKQP